MRHRIIEFVFSSDLPTLSSKVGFLPFFNARSVSSLVECPALKQGAYGSFDSVRNYGKNQVKFTCLSLS